MSLLCGQFQLLLSHLFTLSIHCQPWCRHSLVACAVLSLPSSCSVCFSTLVCPATQAPSLLPPQASLLTWVQDQQDQCIQLIPTPFPQRELASGMRGCTAGRGRLFLLLVSALPAACRGWALKPHVCVWWEERWCLSWGRSGLWS